MAEPLAAYLAGAGLITAIGGDVNGNYHAVRAGISGYQRADYLSANHKNITLAQVPEAALAPITPKLARRGTISFYERQTLRLSHIAAAQAMGRCPSKAPLPLLFASPSYSLEHVQAASFFDQFCEQTKIAIDHKSSRIFATGRAAMLEAINLALRYLTELGHPFVLIGGCDSPQNSAYLKTLEEQGRLATTGIDDSFVPGEGASFLLLAKDPQYAASSLGRGVAIGPVGLGYEEGHIQNAAQPFSGQGLAKALREATKTLCENDTQHRKITGIYSSMNGESYWSKELAVAITRNKNAFSDDYHVAHPADCFGDLGSATGGALIALASQGLLSQHISGPQLVQCSSDQSYRAALCIDTINLNINTNTER